MVYNFAWLKVEQDGGPRRVVGEPLPGVEMTWHQPVNGGHPCGTWEPLLIELPEYYATMIDVDEAQDRYRSW